MTTNNNGQWKAGSPLSLEYMLTELAESKSVLRKRVGMDIGNASDFWMGFSRFVKTPKTQGLRPLPEKGITDPAIFSETHDSLFLLEEFENRLLDPTGLNTPLSALGV